MRSDGERLCRGIYRFDVVDYERSFWDEIWGCVKYIGIPYDTLLDMPIQDRKVWIMKHNKANSESQDGDSGGLDPYSVNNMMLNGLGTI